MYVAYFLIMINFSKNQKIRKICKLFVLNLYVNKKTNVVPQYCVFKHSCAVSCDVITHIYSKKIVAILLMKPECKTYSKRKHNSLEIPTHVLPNI